MKRVALLIACLLIASTAIAAEKTTTKKSEGVSAVKKSKKISKPWEPTAFVEDGERLPPNYSGLDPEKFLHMFKSKLESPKKGEFETSEQYEQRTVNKEALLAPINTSSLYAFRVETLMFSEYDADTLTYKPTHYKCNPIKNSPTEIEDGVAC